MIQPRVIVRALFVVALSIGVIITSYLLRVTWREPIAIISLRELVESDMPSNISFISGIVFASCIIAAAVGLRKLYMVATLVRKDKKPGYASPGVLLPENSGKQIQTSNLSTLNARNEQTTLPSLDEIFILDLLGKAIDYTGDIEQVLDATLQLTLGMSGCDLGAIYLLYPTQEKLRLVANSEVLFEQLADFAEIRIGDGVVGVAAQAMEPVLAAEMDRGFIESKVDIGKPPFADAGFPLIKHPAELLGVLAVGKSDRRMLSSTEIKTLQAAANFMAIAIAKFRSVEHTSKHAAELESIVDQRTLDLREVLEALWNSFREIQRADRFKMTVITAFSHELRTPLSTIKGTVSVLREHSKVLPSNQVVEHLIDIENEVDKLTEWITNVLILFRLDGGKLHIERSVLRIEDVMKHSIYLAQKRSTSHTIIFSYNSDSKLVFADGLRVEQILANLIDNAVKYSPDGSTITVGLTEDKENAIISVQDEGRGIAPEYLTRVFEHFYQIREAQDTGPQGIGLGLAIALRLVEAHGGRIWVESIEDKGATFFFTLPLAKNIEQIGH